MCRGDNSDGLEVEELDGKHVTHSQKEHVKQTVIKIPNQTFPPGILLFSFKFN